MKILLLCWRDTGHPQGGGSERYLEHVGRYLASRGHEVILRTAAYPGAPHREKSRGISFQRYGGRYTVYVRAAIAMVLGRFGHGLLKGIDAVVDTQNGIPFFARFFAGCPTILLTHHCHRRQWPVAGPVIGRFGWWLESWLSPRINRKAEYVTVSRPSRDELVELGVAAGRIHIIRNGVDPVPGKDAGRGSVPGKDAGRGPLPAEEIDTDAVAATASSSRPGVIGRGDRPLHVVTLSRLVPHKRIEHALEAVARIPSVVLDVIGSGWWEPKLREYAHELGVGHRVIFHGQVSDTHKHELLAGADLHLMPSKAEGWGLAVIEAAQHGVPTVGYAASGGLQDSVNDGKTGVLIPEDDLEQFIAAVHELLDDAVRRRKLGAHARQRATGFSWDDTGRSFERLLEDMMPSE